MNELSKASAVVRRRVGEEGENQRVDNFLVRHCRNVPKSHIYRILRSGEVRVNGRRVEPSFKLSLGDEVRIPPLRLGPDKPAAAQPPRRDYELAYDDDFFLAIDKPAGIAVHGGSGLSFGVIEQLRNQWPQAKFLELVHRIDRGTSGLLLVARKRSALTALQDMLRRGEIHKRYLALVKGRWMNPLQHVRLPLHKYLTQDGERRVSVREDGKAAHSIVRLKARWSNFSLVEVELRTGRTHQIRVHLSHLGYPICGDDKYGDFELNKTLERLGLRRMFLHAAGLGLTHPVTGAAVALDAPLPDELESFITALDANEPRDHGATL